MTETGDRHRDVTDSIRPLRRGTRIAFTRVSGALAGGACALLAVLFFAAMTSCGDSEPAAVSDVTGEGADSTCERAAMWPTSATSGVAATVQVERISEIIADYGTRFPATFAGYRWVAAPAGPRVAVGFTADRESHRTELTALTRHEIVVCPSTRSTAELDAIHATIPPEVVTSSVTVGWDRLRISLKANQEPLARRLHERHGEVLDLRLGRQPFPAADRTDSDITGCPLLPPPVLLPLSATVILAETRIAPGDDIRGRVTVRNDGDEAISTSFDNPALTTVLRAGTDEVVAAGFDGAIAGTGAGGQFAPGTGMAMSVLGSTSSCTAGASHALTPGEYDVIVTLSDDAHPGRGAVRSNRVRITVR
jgi:hypothetical protein